MGKPIQSGIVSQPLQRMLRLGGRWGPDLDELLSPVIIAGRADALPWRAARSWFFADSLAAVAGVVQIYFVGCGVFNNPAAGFRTIQVVRSLKVQVPAASAVVVRLDGAGLAAAPDYTAAIPPRLLDKRLPNPGGSGSAATNYPAALVMIRQRVNAPVAFAGGEGLGWIANDSAVPQWIALDLVDGLVLANNHGIFISVTAVAQPLSIAVSGEQYNVDPPLDTDIAP